MRKSNKIITYLNGKFIPVCKAKIPVFDRGLLYGEGLFETMRSYSGYIFRLDEHLNRLSNSCRTLGIKLPLTKQKLKDNIYKTLKKNNFINAYIRVTITRGESDIGFIQTKYGSPNLFIITNPLSPYPAYLYDRGVKAIISASRQNEYSPVCNIKSLNYLDRILIKKESRSNKADEAILLNTKGHITEGTTSNIFLVKDNVLMTPTVDSGVLPGITRQTVLEIASKLKLKIRVIKIPLKEIFNAQEVFLTNSLIEILPVVKINRKPVGTGRPGEITKYIHRLYKNLVTRSIA